MSADDTYAVNVVAYEADGVWFAQCVEYDISAWAERVTDLMGAFEKQFRATIAVNQHLGRVGLDRIPPAPEKFRRMLDGASLNLTHREAAVHRPVHFQSFGIAELAV